MLGKAKPVERTFLSVYLWRCFPETDKNVRPTVSARERVNSNQATDTREASNNRGLLKPNRSL